MNPRGCCSRKGDRAMRKGLDMSLPENHLMGRKFDMVTVSGPPSRMPGTHYAVSGEWVYPCLCDCGAEANITRSWLISGTPVSCGCRKRSKAKEYSTIHGQSGTRLYRIWCGMKQRCSNPKNKSFADYGGRGVRVCPGWSEFLGFHAWAVSAGYRDDLSIDRINNDGNYEPGNCRWATPKEQASNQRPNPAIVAKMKQKRWGGRGTRGVPGGR